MFPFGTKSHSLYFCSHLFSSAKALSSEHFNADYCSMVSSVINLEVRLLYAFPAHMKQWCPASHCSLLSHFLKRERPVCPQEIFAASVKTSSLAYAARGARRKSEPCQDTVPHFLNHSLQQASGYRKTRMAAG